MQIKNKAIYLAAVILTAISPITSLAATGTSISSVSLRIESDITAGDSGGDVEVTSSSSRFIVDDVEVTNEPDDEWEGSDKPRVKITLEAEDDYYFPSGFSKSSVSLSGDDATVSSVSRSGSDTLVVNVTLEALEDDDSDYDLDVGYMEWNEDDGIASWEESMDAIRYEVRLYRGSSSVTSVLTTDDTEYDFSSHITTSGTYTFRVRGVYSSSNKGTWEESDSWYVSSDIAEEFKSFNTSTGTSGYSGTSGPSSGTVSGAWLLDNVGWWYCNADKTYTVSNWQYIDGQWYYFNESGYMVTGWVLWNSYWYYLGTDGAMLTSTTTPDGFYVREDGVWIQ